MSSIHFVSFIFTACLLRTRLHPLRNRTTILSEPAPTLFFTPKDQESLSNGKVSLTIQPEHCLLFGLSNLDPTKRFLILPNSNFSDSYPNLRRFERGSSLHPPVCRNGTPCTSPLASCVIIITIILQGLQLPTQLKPKPF